MKQKNSSTEQPALSGVVGSRSIPQLRFPEFKEEWERIPLIELTENGFSNGAFNDPRKVGRGYRIINVKDMYVDGTINIDNLTRVEIDEKEFSKNRVHFGDIFFTRSSLVKEGIAYSNVNLTYAEDLTFDGHLIRMRPKKEKYSPVFLYYNFATSNARIQFIQRGKTTTMTTIGQEDIATVEIILPTLPEQTRIASFFTAIDQKLTQLKQKKTLLEQYKKGLMQKIFSQELRFKDEKEFPKWEKKKKLG
jgi:type I restriction enzyme S subunit